jgi:hypothetical protein
VAGFSTVREAAGAGALSSIDADPGPWCRFVRPRAIHAAPAAIKPAATAVSAISM